MSSMPRTIDVKNGFSMSATIAAHRVVRWRRSARAGPEGLVAERARRPRGTRSARSDETVPVPFSTRDTVAERHARRRGRRRRSSSSRGPARDATMAARAGRHDVPGGPCEDRREWRQPSAVAGVRGACRWIVRQWWTVAPPAASGHGTAALVSTGGSISLAGRLSSVGDAIGPVDVQPGTTCMQPLSMRHVVERHPAPSCCARGAPGTPGTPRPGATAFEPPPGRLRLSFSMNIIGRRVVDVAGVDAEAPRPPTRAPAPGGRRLVPCRRRRPARA